MRAMSWLVFHMSRVIRGTYLTLPSVQRWASLISHLSEFVFRICHGRTLPRPSLLPLIHTIAPFQSTRKNSFVPFLCKINVNTKFMYLLYALVQMWFVLQKTNPITKFLYQAEVFSYHWRHVSGVSQYQCFSWMTYFLSYGSCTQGTDRVSLSAYIRKFWTKFGAYFYQLYKDPVVYTCVC